MMSNSAKVEKICFISKLETTIPSLSNGNSVVLDRHKTEVSSRSETELEAEDHAMLSAHRQLKLLLVSDDDAFCSLLRAYLQRLGFSLLICSTSDRAESQFLTRTDIDLWLVDTQALGVEGAYFAVKVREFHPAVPIVLFAGADRNQNMLQRFFWEDWLRIEKSADLGTLLAFIQRALSGPSGANENRSAPEDLEPAFEDDWMKHDTAQRNWWHNRN
jgi:DNA-binding response OmpR family regulator